MNETIRLIRKSIISGSTYLPTRNLAAMMATRARPKDYFGQAKSIYNGFLSRWRYVRDPVIREMVIASPEASFRLVMAGDGIGVGEGLGAGDCDCATIALGSLFESVGFPVRISTTANSFAPKGRLMNHIYPEVFVPGYGWIAADPVIHPKSGFGTSAPNSRKVVYMLDGNIVKYSGNLGYIKSEVSMYPEIWERPPWRTYGYSGLFGTIDDDEPLYPWETFGLSGFGYLVPELGSLSTTIPIEVGPAQTIYFDGFARTPMVEVSPEDFTYMRQTGRPYHGMFGLGDDGEVYYYDGFGGFFRRLFKKVKKAVKTVAGKVKKGMKKLVKVLPGGKAIVSVGGKKKTVDMDIVKPTAVRKKGTEAILKKLKGPMATRKPKTAAKISAKPVSRKAKVVPISQIVPGDGPAIAVALRFNLKIGKQKKRIKYTGLSGPTTSQSMDTIRSLSSLYG